MYKKKNLVAIVGPTAVGKTDIAVDVAKEINAEIISADSMQVYRYMDIGTAKPSKNQQQQVKHYMIDIIDPDEEFSVADFQHNAKKYLNDIYVHKKTPLLVGGTGLYINALCYNYIFPKFDKDEKLRDKLGEIASKNGNLFLHNRLKQIDPISAKKIHPNNLRRVIRALEVYIKTKKPFSYFEQKTKNQPNPYNLTIIGLTRDKDELYERINDRVKLMVESGFVEEVKKLLEMGFSKNLNSMRGLGYRQMVYYLENEIKLEEAIALTARDTRRFAKRQYTWFLRDKNIIWINVSSKDKDLCKKEIISILEGKSIIS